jgi:hypothetical protein
MSRVEVKPLYAVSHVSERFYVVHLFLFAAAG